MKKLADMTVDELLALNLDVENNATYIKYYDLDDERRTITENHYLFDQDTDSVAKPLSEFVSKINDEVIYEIKRMIGRVPSLADRKWSEPLIEFYYNYEYTETKISVNSVRSESDDDVIARLRKNLKSRFSRINRDIVKAKETEEKERALLMKLSKKYGTKS